MECSQLWTFNLVNCILILYRLRCYILRISYRKKFPSKYKFKLQMFCIMAFKTKKCEFKWHTPSYQSVWYQYVRSAIKVYYVLGLQLFTFELNSVYSCLFCSLTLNMFSLSMHKLPACKFFSILLYYSSEWLICLQHLFVSMSELLSNIDSHVRIMLIVSV